MTVNPTSIKALVLFCMLLGAIVTLPGCAGKLKGVDKGQEEELVIPDFASAKEQFQFAKMYQGSLLIAPELKRRRLQMEKVMQCYSKVLSNFPNDTMYVPLTYLEMGDCAAQSDDMVQAVAYYQKAQQSSQEEFIQARSQYSIGRIYNMQGKYPEAKAIFKNIIDTYGHSKSGKVQDVAKRAAQLYYQVVDPTEEGGKR